jgi:hypothetical protein
MSKTEIQEKLIEIATRIKGKGDTWEVNSIDKIQYSLTDALEAWFQIATVKPKAFRLNLEEGKLYAILPQEVEIKEPEPRKLSIYGEYEF